MNKFALILLIISFGCSNTKEYKVQFGDVDWPEKGSPVYIKGLKVGQVKKIEFDKDKKALATIQIEGYIKITKGSIFTMQPELMGGKSVEIILSDAKEIIDKDRIHSGITKPPDPTGFTEISDHELDSLAKIDRDYKLTDTLVKILKKVKEIDDKKSKN